MEEPEFYICNVCHDSAVAWWPKTLSPDHREVPCLKCNGHDISVKELEELPPVNDIQTMDIVHVQTDKDVIEHAIVKRKEKTFAAFLLTTGDDLQLRNRAMNDHIEITDRLENILAFQEMIKLSMTKYAWKRYNKKGPQT